MNEETNRDVRCDCCDQILGTSPGPCAPTVECEFPGCKNETVGDCCAYTCRECGMNVGTCHLVEVPVPGRPQFADHYCTTCGTAKKAAA